MLDNLTRLALLAIACASTLTIPPALVAAAPPRPCKADPARLEQRSRELQAIVEADQADREGWMEMSAKRMHAVTRRDVRRRKRVGEIFGEGCFSKAEDYAAAALVYQHGDVRDHFLQAFLWARRAVELGDEGRKRLMALAIDRYLVHIGHKQLFASQASKAGRKPDACWCLEAVEPSFPDETRKRIGGQSLKEAHAWLAELNQGMECPDTECPQALAPTPEGTVPGFW